jgi:hypothetical protein
MGWWPCELEERAGGWFPLSGPVLAPSVVDVGPDLDTPRFDVGDRVRVREWHPPGHTRCPGYIRGKNGMVVRVDGIHSVPDIEAHGTARRREPTYSFGLTPLTYGGTASAACGRTSICGTATWSDHERGRPSPGSGLAG